MNRGVAVWYWILLAAFVSALITSILAVHSEFQRANVKLEAQELADELAGAIRSVYLSAENFSRDFQLPDDIGGFAYTITVDNSGVSIKFFDEKISRYARYENIPIRSDKIIVAGKSLTLIKSGTEVVIYVR